MITFKDGVDVLFKISKLLENSLNLVILTDPADLAMDFEVIK